MMPSSQRQGRLSLPCQAQPTRSAWLLRNALSKIEAAYGKGYANPRIVLTAEEQRALERAITAWPAELERQFGMQPAPPVQLAPFLQHGVPIQLWYHSDGHLYLTDSAGRRLLACLDMWA